MIRPSLVRPVVAVLALLLLVGCGRKGALDAPPGAWATPGVAPPQVVVPEKPPAIEYGPDGKPLPRTGPHRQLPGDWLID